ncbi:hypothetical protein K1719_002816 [Acacia pycnantha]|nr:hypothetical protein K1719_002816 [Acacia pycnantha]
MPSAFRSPDFRGDHNETQAIQWLNLHKAMRNGKHLLWFKEWSVLLLEVYVRPTFESIQQKLGTGFVCNSYLVFLIL